MPQTGSYSVNLLGSIASNLASLQGYDVMALELIQNADDARASSIIFDVTNDALVITNDGVFSTCHALSQSDCPLLDGPENIACDFHRLTELASGGKARDPTNIGRFGIGFVSTYQVCDYPEVRSAGTSLTLYPEKAKTQIKNIGDDPGTRFVLAWATNPQSVVREGIKASHVEQSDLPKIEEDIARILDRALLFLQHLTYAELRRNGKLVCSCHLRRDDDGILIIEFGPEKTEQMWLICNADARDAAIELIDDYSQLGKDDRRTQVTLAYRLDSDPIKDGLFYAFLPTEQKTALPIHINADFYPEADRKSVIFSGEKHQQRWNELLIETAAATVADNLISMKDRLGPDLIWETLQRAWELKDDATANWHSFFWDVLAEKINETSELAWSSKNQWTALGDTVLPFSGLSKSEISFIGRLDLQVAHDSITKRAQNVLQKLGTTYLSAKRLASVLEGSSWFDGQISEPPMTEAQEQTVFQPLWQLMDRLSTSLRDGQSADSYYEHIPLLLTDNLVPIMPSEAKQTFEHIHTALAEQFPELGLIDRSIYRYPTVLASVPELAISDIANHLEETLDSTQEAANRFGASGEKLHRFYRALADLAEGDSDNSDCSPLRDCPIFLTGGGYQTAESVILPGNFKDPIRFATILESSVLDTVIESFFIRDLGIERLELRTYIADVLPRFFESDVEIEKVNLLLSELSQHPATLDDEELVEMVRELPLVPTQDEDWRPAYQVYYRTDKLVDVIGNNPQYWVDENRLDPAPSIRGYVEKLGIRRDPSGSHLAERILQLAQGTPTTSVTECCERTFYAACDLADMAGRSNSDEIEDFVSTIARERCLPALEDDENWWRPDELYAPYNAEAFSSQASILPFRNTKKIRELVRLLRIKDSPETSLVVDHLRHCVDSSTAPSKAVYEVLNGRCEKDRHQIRALSDLACIYDENRQRFLRPNQLFWHAPHLGDRALKVPPSLKTYQRLFETLGVNESPSADDYFDLIQDVINEYGDTGHQVPEQDLQIYRKCLEMISEAITAGDEQIEDRCRTLREEPCLLNFDGKLCFPDEIAIRDSEWHETHFENELRGMLTDYRADLQPFYRTVRVKHVSEVITPEITQQSGDEALNGASQLLQDRADCVIRILHDRPRSLLANLFLRLTSIQVIYCEELEISFVCSLTDPAVRSPEHPTTAHYEKDTNVLYVARRDVEAFSVPALNSLLHILATSTAGASIPNLVLNCDRMLTSSSLEAAEEILTYAGFPSSVDLEESEIEDAELGDLGSQSGTEGDDLPAVPPGSNDVEDSGTDTDTGRAQSESDQEGAKKESESGSTGDGEGGSGTQSKSSQKKRGQRRKDRLLSYVNHGKDGDSEKATDPSIREHNLTVEDKGRAAVVLFEKERGRDAIPQAQENPGWDIVSTDIDTEDVRYIEVKAIDGEWSNVGVGLSRLQFSEAWERHNNYWLYVVEYAGYEDKERIYPIQSPATKVTSFMFDHNWRDIADIEDQNPHAAFQVGSTVDCGVLGTGRITEIVEIGRTKQLILDFGRGNVKALYLNVATMKVIDETEA